MKEFNDSQTCKYLKSLYKMGPQLNFAPVLIKYCITLMLTDQMNKIIWVLQEVVYLAQFKDSPHETYFYANHLFFNNRFIESIIFYSISFALLKQRNDLVGFGQLTNLLCFGIVNSVQELFHRSLINAEVVKQEFVAFFYNIASVIAHLPDIAPNLSYSLQGCLLMHIFVCHEMINDIPGKEDTKHEALKISKRYHQRDGSDQNFSLREFFSDVIERMNSYADQQHPTICILTRIVESFVSPKSDDSPCDKDANGSKNVDADASAKDADVSKNEGAAVCEMENANFCENESADVSKNECTAVFEQKDLNESQRNSADVSENEKALKYVLSKISLT